MKFSGDYYVGTFYQNTLQNTEFIDYCSIAILSCLFYLRGVSNGIAQYENMQEDLDNLLNSEFKTNNILVGDQSFANLSSLISGLAKNMTGLDFKVMKKNRLVFGGKDD